MDTKKFFTEHPWLRELAYLCLFGFLSALMGLVEFQIPGLSGTATDLREIPILISFVYLRSPLSLFGIIGISALSMAEGGAYTSYLLMHVPASIIVWFIYQKIKSLSFSNVQLAIFWCLVTLLYYALIVPTYIYTERILLNNPLPVKTSFVALFYSLRFEIITSALVSALYIIQHNVRNQLREHQINLENTIKQRTLQLTESNQQLLTLNEELTASHEEVRSLNDNLEKLVQDRTEKINLQLKQLEKYAHMNSHEVRGPLARVIGLVGLIKIDKQNGADPVIVNKIEVAAEELDQVVKKMNLLLVEEVIRKRVND